MTGNPQITPGNVAGGGINIAQRVMDCGDAEHILLSSNIADVLREVTRWKALLSDLGTTKVKHDVSIHIFSLHGKGIGNPARPRKLKKVTGWKRWGIGIAIILLTILIVAHITSSPSSQANVSSPSSQAIVAINNWRDLCNNRQREMALEAVVEYANRRHISAAAAVDEIKSAGCKVKRLSKPELMKLQQRAISTNK